MKTKILAIVPTRQNRSELDAVERLCDKIKAELIVRGLHDSVLIEGNEETTPVVQLNTEDKDIQDVDHLCLIAGPLMCMKEMWFSETVHHYVHLVVKSGGLIAGFCSAIIAVSCANIDYLRGKKITVWPAKSVLERAGEAGAIVTDKSVEIDGNIVTCKWVPALDLWEEIMLSKLG